MQVNKRKCACDGNACFLGVGQAHGERGGGRWEAKRLHHVENEAAMCNTQSARHPRGERHASDRPINGRTVQSVQISERVSYTWYVSVEPRRVTSIVFLISHSVYRFYCKYLFTFSYFLQIICCQ